MAILSYLFDNPPEVNVALDIERNSLCTDTAVSDGLSFHFQ